MTTVAVEALTASERKELTTLEARIQSGLKAYYEVGEALLLIRSKRLYRTDYATFKEYLLERWGYTRQHAARLIDAAEVVAILSPIGDIPMNEAQARELSGLKPDELRAVWTVVKETAPNGKITAPHIKSVAIVCKEAIATGAIDGGDGFSIPIKGALYAAISDETAERAKRQAAHIEERTGNASKSRYTGQGVALKLDADTLHLKLKTGVWSDIHALLGKDVIIFIREATDGTD